MDSAGLAGKEDQDMKTVSFKLKQKNQFEYQLKNGARIIDKIKSVKDGWYTGCKVHDTLEIAIEYARNSAEERACAFGSNVKVVIA